MLIDTHCHLTSNGLVERLDAVLAAARAAGVERILHVAVNPDDARRAFDVLGGRPEVFCIAGIHPHEAAGVTPDRLADLRAILTGADHPRPVAVGETGLDFHYEFAAHDQQQAVFEAHLALAGELDLPVVIHSRESEGRVCDILAGYPTLSGRVVFHCFSGDVAIARRALDLGCFLSFTGVVTFKKSAEIQASARFAPADRIMIETDAPWLSPEPVRKIRPNEPALLVHTARCIAGLRGMAYEEFAALTTANAIRFFRLPPEHRPTDIR